MLNLTHAPAAVADWFRRRTTRSVARPRRRRAALVAAVTIALTAGTVVAAAPAYACDVNNHCYAIASYATPTIQELHATISPISGPGVGSSGDFVTDEIWLVATSSSCWVEVGYIDNFANINGVSSGLSEFWYDSRPNGGGAHGHVLVSNPVLQAKTFYVMQGVTSGTFSVGDGTNMATSTANLMTPANAQVGSETTTATSCSWANDSSMSYSTGSGWVGFPSASTSVNTPQQLAWVSYPTNMNAGVKC